jgi:uncharacterized protein (TIGR02246 family)
MKWHRQVNVRGAAAIRRAAPANMDVFDSISHMPGTGAVPQRREFSICRSWSQRLFRGSLFTPMEEVSMSGNRIAGIAIGVMAMAALGGFFALNQTARSDPPAKEKENRLEDRTAIREMMKGFIQAFEKGDAAAASKYLTEEAAVVPDEGDILKGRETIQKTYAEFFAKNPKRKCTLETEKLDFTSRNTAIEEGHMKVVPEKGESETHRYHVMYVREDGKWLISVIKEWPSESGALRELDWLIGKWVAKRDDLEIHSDYQWFGDKSFILAKFKIKGKEKTFSGMQMIGIDPKTGDLRSWTFEHDGGFGEANVSRDGKKWVFDMATVLTNGSVLSSTNIMTKINGDAFSWQPTNLIVDGSPVGDPAPIKVTRVKGKETQAKR